MKRPALHALAALAACCLLRGAEPAPNSLSPAEVQEGWSLLFDGQSFKGWHGYSKSTFPDRGWTIADGCIKNAQGTGRPAANGGDIVTDESFTDFDFRFEWRIAPGGNSGIKYFIKERTGAPGAKMYVGDDGRSAVGHEYQLLDDEKHPDGVQNGPIRQSGSLYSLIPPNAAKKLKPVGEFNESRLLVRGKHVEHWLNGAKVLGYDLESPELMATIGKSKYGTVPGFGTKFATPILIQDHGDEVWLRNLKIRRLDTR
ncbi:MAG TPA: DUF1080 domain-containing protein [Opitutaceae bacterium]|nr:DUF1080 domain-containing protein [Opitutaceae bacterium]